MGKERKKHSSTLSQVNLKMEEEYKENYSGNNVIISSSMRVHLTKMNYLLAKVNPYSSRNIKVRNR
jgi:hypothetical protein